MNPPKRAVVFSFDEKTQCQTLDRTQPSLPLPPRRAGTMTHDCKRNGTTDLFTALDIATGEVITEYRRRHTAADVLAFLEGRAGTETAAGPGGRRRGGSSPPGGSPRRS